ncbi:MAG: hypothetical protein ACFFCP_04700 [Promethearchaeota archaeon]
MALHPVFVHFHTGILVAAAAVALVSLVLRILFKDNINTPNTRLATIFHQADTFIYVGSIIGFMGLVVAMVTGFMEPAYPVEVLAALPIMRFKILWSVVCVEIYLYLIVIRTKMGDRVWIKPSSYLPYGILVVVGGGIMMIVAALGGIDVYGTSILEPVLNWIGIPWP